MTPKLPQPLPPPPPPGAPIVTLTPRCLVCGAEWATGAIWCEGPFYFLRRTVRS